MLSASDLDNLKDPESNEERKGEIFLKAQPRFSLSSLGLI
jgi:hypothetical protein